MLYAPKNRNAINRNVICSEGHAGSKYIEPNNICFPDERFHRKLILWCYIITSDISVSTEELYYVF